MKGKLFFLISLLIFISFNISAKEKRISHRDHVRPAKGQPSPTSFLNSPEPIYNVKANDEVIGVTQFLTYEYEEEISNAGFLYLFFHKDFFPVRVYKDGTLVQQQAYFFKDGACEGEPYRIYVSYFEQRREDPKFIIVHPYKGHIMDYKNSLYYYPKGGIFEPFISNSFYSNGTCYSRTESYQTLYLQLLPNDSQVTGIKEYPLPGPLTIEGLQEYIPQ